MEISNGPCHIQHHKFRTNAPSQRHAARPDAAGHIEILPSLHDKPVGPSQRCLARVFHDPEAGQTDLAAVRVSGKGQMGSGRYTREPHRIMRKHNGRSFWREPSQQLFGLGSLHASIRNSHEVDRVIFEIHDSTLVIKDGDGMPAQCVSNFLRAVQVVMIS